MKKTWTRLLAVIIAAVPAGAALAGEFAPNVNPSAHAILALKSALSKNQRENLFGFYTHRALYMMERREQGVDANYIQANFPAGSDIVTFSGRSEHELRKHGGSVGSTARYLTDGSVVYTSDYQPGDGRIYGALFAADGSVIGGMVEIETTISKDVVNINTTCTFGKLPDVPFLSTP